MFTTHDSLLTTRRIDAICAEFETAWRSGQRPRLETIISDAEPVDRSSLLADLIALEFELRQEQGEAVRVAEYVRRFPDDQDAVVAALALVIDGKASTALGPSRNQADSGLQAARYRLGEPVGAGGMGVVVRARDEHLERELAVKVLAEHLQTRREAVERFLREARICAQLQHPGIIPVHDLGWLGERPYFAMKLVIGQSLSDLLKGDARSGQDLARLLEVFVRVCETVAYAHARGVVHRDLKPANVMLGSFGEVYVIDWGLAKQMPTEFRRPSGETAGETSHPPAADSTLAQPLPNPLSDGAEVKSAWTFAGDVVGTPEYMSPEQACGDAEAVDQRSDVFALGAILCEILTGVPPYPGGDRTRQLEHAQQGDLTETLGRLDRSAADRELIDLARECLAIEPADRPPDASHVLQRLTAFLRGVQDKLRNMELDRVEAQARGEERRRRQRTMLTLAASLMLLLGLLGAGTAWIVQREAARQRDETARREQVQRQLEEALDEVAQLYAGAPEDGRQDPLRRTRIRELARRAETLAESAEADPAQRRRVRDLRDRLLAEDADGRLLDRLETIRLKRAEVNPRLNKFASGRTRPMYRSAFDDYGLDLETVEAGQAVAKIRSRPRHVVEACVFGLESWRSLFKTASPQRLWIDAVLDGIDDHRWRREIRQACRDQDWATVGKLLKTTEDEPLSADAVDVAAMALMEARQLDLALQLLQAAQLRHPRDFWINEYLALIFFCLPDRRLEESVRFSTAALAIREAEAAYFNLGAALFDLRRDAEAEQAFRAAIRLQPDYVQAHVSLADVLERQGRTAEAAEVRQRAGQLQGSAKKSVKNKPRADAPGSPNR